MSEDFHQKKVTGRLIRSDESEPRGNQWLAYSPAERIEAVWMLTKLCLAWSHQLQDEPRLQRTITHIQRKRG